MGGAIKVRNASVPRASHGRMGQTVIPASDAGAHIVQLALSPIFLLSGIATLLNVFTQRLARISDQVTRAMTAADKEPARIERLRLRSRALDAAVLLAAIAGVLTCGAAMTLFLGAIRAGSTQTVLFALFGGALSCSILGLAAFAFEMVLAGRTVRDKVDEREREG